jgi:pimeloyl-ACP methyl ester carboxylesterase
MLTRSRYLRWLTRPATLIALVIVGLSQLVSACMQFRMSDTEVRQYFADKATKPTFHTYQVGQRTMHYAAIGADTLPTVLLVHGSPGAWDGFIDYLGDSVLHGQVRLLAVDRPGYGKSGFGRAERDLRQQAALLQPILAAHRNGKRLVLVGHSYGGPLIARLAMDYPDLVDGLVFLAPSIDPAQEKTKWFQYPAEWWAINWLFPRALLVCNREIRHLQGDLTAALPGWQQIRQPVIFIQGEKDSLVPIENADFALRMLTNTQVEMIRLPGVDHFIPWSHPQVVKAAILKAAQGR